MKPFGELFVKLSTMESSVSFGEGNFSNIFDDHPTKMNVFDSITTAFGNATMDVGIKTIAACLLILLSLPIIAIHLRRHLNPLSRLPGPKPSSFMMGNIVEIFKAPPGDLHTKWTSETQSGAISYAGMFGNTRLSITDPRALIHVLQTNSYSWPKSKETRSQLKKLIGEGILVAEGDQHKRQRRMLQPAFAPSHLKALVPTFFEKAEKLREKWIELIDNRTVDETSVEEDAKLAKNKTEVSKTSSTDSSSSDENPEASINIIKWLSRCTLDIIGTTGFGYEFDALDSDKDRFGRAFSNLSTLPTSTLSLLFLVIITLPYTVFPFLAKIPFLRAPRLKKMDENEKTLKREARQIVNARREEVLKELEDGSTGTKKGRDLISLLIKANLQEDNAKVKLNDEELIGQVATFLLAGHETTSTALTWTLYELASNPDMQTRLRQEIRSSGLLPITASDSSSADDLSSLPYLDAVCREALRVWPPVSLTTRILETKEGDHIPLSKPVPLRKSAFGSESPVAVLLRSFGIGNKLPGTALSSSDGANDLAEKASEHSTPESVEMIDSLRIEDGQELMLSITACSKAESIWGPDAAKFKPERWLGEEGELLGTRPGVWAGIMAFLAGPRGCIGYRFAVLEMKAILAVLIDEFEFRNALSPEQEVIPRAFIVTRPTIKGEDKGYRMPLKVTRAARD